MLLDYEINTNDNRDFDEVCNFVEKHAGAYGVWQQNPGQISAAMNKAGFVGVSETDWTKNTKPTFDRLRKLAKPFVWVRPNMKIASLLVNPAMANHGYSPMYEAGVFRYLVYQAEKPKGKND